jgi:hypothetical protein
VRLVEPLLNGADDIATCGVRQAGQLGQVFFDIAQRNVLGRRCDQDYPLLRLFGGNCLLDGRAPGSSIPLRC